MKPILLKHLAQLYTGFTIRESLDHLDYGDIKTIQIRDLPKNSKVIDTDNLTGIEWRYDSKPQYLEHDSIVLVARGEPSAFIFKGDASHKVVVSNPFIVINLKTDDLLPEFIVWYINNAQKAKEHFAINARGNALPITTIATVKDLPIIIPSIEEQKSILAMQETADKEVQLFSNLIQLREEYNRTYAQYILNKSIN